jgi:hypothetical protein
LIVLLLGCSVALQVATFLEIRHFLPGYRKDGTRASLPVWVDNVSVPVNVDEPLDVNVTK